MVFKLFSERMQKLIKEKGFIEPTLPQRMGMPEIKSGENVLIIAPTGTGKTESAMLPLLDMVSQAGGKPISILYINPLRSLSRDLLDRLCWWVDKLDMEIGVRHGDVGARERAAQREMPPHVLITTPETLGAILTGKIMKQHLKNVRHVIIDEIHELVESKRGTQLSLLLERLSELAGNFQRIGLSATIGSPEEVARFLGEDVRIIHAETEKKYDIRVETPSHTRRDKDISEELFIGIDTTSRLRRLYDLINSHSSVIAFTNTRETAEVISSRLRALDKELKQTVHHGSLSKERRIKGEQDFKHQVLKSLIATSSLELGIDIGSIDLVIQYLSPRQVARLVQRVGRSGHKVGGVSKGIILSGEEDLFESTVIADRAMKRQLEGVKIHESALDVLGSQIVGLALDEYDISDEKIYKIIKRSYAYRGLEKNEFMRVLKLLDSLRLLWLNEMPGGFTIRRRRKAWQYYFDNLSTIPDTNQYRVISIIENEPIGMLDEEFVAEHGQPGNRFVFSGRAWKIIQVDGNKVTVEPVEDIESAIPAWEGELIPVPYAVAQEVGKLRKLIANTKDPGKAVMEKYNIDASSADGMTDIIKKHKATHTVPDDENILIENYKDFVIIHLCSGSMVNDTIGRYLGAVLTTDTGVSVNIKTDPYRIMLQTTATAEKVKDVLLDATDIDDVLKTEVERSSMFKWRFLHVARRMGIISRQARYEKINVNKIIADYADSPAYKEALREVFLEKMDLENAKSILDKIAKKAIKIKIEPGLSFLGESGLVHQFSEVMKPRMPEKEIFLAFRRRLMKTVVRLICVNCGEYNLIKAVREVDEQPECPKCNSRLIAVTGKRRVGAIKLVKKRLKKKELTKDELAELQTIRRSADLVIVYGKKAVIALAGHGIGPQTAAAILSKLQPSKEKFFADILEAEKQFARTKPFWH